MPYPGGNLVRVTPTVVAGETANNDVMFDATEIPNAVSSRGGVSMLQGVTIIDKDGEQADFDVIFMQVQTNFGSADSASTITDGNLQASKVIGCLNIDWDDADIIFAQDSGNATIFSATGPVANASAHQLPLLVQAAEGETSIYFTAIVNTTDNADWAATDDLEFVFHFQYLG